MSTAWAKIKVGVDEKGAVASIKRLAKEWGEFATGANQALELVSKAWRGVANSIRRVTDATGHMIENAEAQEQAERKLALVLKQSGDARKETFDDLVAYAAELQNLTNVGDESTIALQAQLLQLGVAKSRLKEATRTTLGFVASGRELNDTTRAVARAYTGQITALREYNASITDTASLTRVSNEMFQAAIEKTKTFGGAVEALKGRYEDMLEPLGRVITQSGSLRGLIKLLEVAVQGVTMKLDAATRGTDLFALALKEVTATIHPISEGLVLIGQSAILVEQMFTGIKVAANSAMLGIIKLISAVPGLNSKAMGLLGETFSETTAEMSRDLLGLEERLASFAEGVRGASDKVRKALVEASKQAGVVPGSAVDSKAAEESAKARAKAEADRLRKESIARLKIQRAEFERTKEVQDAFNALAEQNADRRIALAKQLVDKNKELAKKHKAAEKEKLDATVNFTAGFITSIAEQLTVGDDFGKRIGRVVAQFVSQLGVMLIQMGTAAVLGSAIGTAVPFLKPLTGSGQGKVAGLAAIAAGTAMVAGGGLLSHAFRDKSSEEAEEERERERAAEERRKNFEFSSGAGGRNRFEASTIDRVGAAADASSGGVNIVINGPVVTNSRQGGRDLAELLGQRARQVV